MARTVPLPAGSAAWVILGSEQVGAVDALDRATALLPDAPSIRLNFAEALLRAGRTDAAEKEEERVRGVEPPLSQGVLVAGLIAVRRGERP